MKKERKNIMGNTLKLPIIIRREIDSSHFYFIKDEKTGSEEFFPGVTTILDEAAPMAYPMRQWLLKNTKEEADDILAETSTFGTKMHDAYEQLLHGSALSLKNEYKLPKEKKHMASFWQWFEDYKPTDLQPEQVIASVKYRYAGTLDLACKINGRLSIIDFKTGSGIYYSHHLQLLAYKKAYEEMYHVRVKDIYILRTGTKHKAGYEFKKLEGKKFEAFRNVYKTYLDLHDGKVPPPPLMNVYPDEIKLNIETLNRLADKLGKNARKSIDEQIDEFQKELDTKGGVKK